MLREISARQLYEWFAYAGLVGLPEQRSDLRMGILASLTANVHRDAKRKASPFKPGDFIPKIREEQMKEQENDLRFALDAIAKRKK